jgi:hypothetical protein
MLTRSTLNQIDVFGSEGKRFPCHRIIILGRPMRPHNPAVGVPVTSLQDGGQELWLFVGLVAICTVPGGLSRPVSS